MKQITSFEQFINYMNRVGIRFHGAGCIPPTQKMWCNIETHLTKLGVTYPFNARWERSINHLHIKQNDRSIRIDPYRYS